MASIDKVKNHPTIRAALQTALDRGETGVAVAAYHKGQLVVDAVAGTVDREPSSQPVDHRTLFPVFSVTKGITALAIHIQAERGLLHYHDKISQHWPEFGVNGKEDITIEHVLSHRSGIPQMPEGVTPELMADWRWMTEQIAKYTPVYPPGRTNAYHVLVWGWIMGEIVVRTDPKHRPFDVFVKEEITGPLGITDFYLGVPDSELSRVAKLSGGDTAPLTGEHNINPQQVFPGSTVHNQRVVQQCVDPGAGAITTAAAVAKIYALLAGKGTLNGVRLLSPERVMGFLQPREGAEDPDKVISIPTWIGSRGYYLGGKEGWTAPFIGDHPEIIYSPGAGGSFAWADLRDDISIVLCHNNMDAIMVFEPEMIWAGVVRAVRKVIAEQDSS